MNTLSMHLMNLSLLSFNKQWAVLMGMLGMLDKIIHGK